MARHGSIRGDKKYVVSSYRTSSGCYPSDHNHARYAG